VAALALAAGSLLATAPAARADSITVTPANPLLYTFTQFTVSGTSTANGDGFVDVDFDGVFLGSAEVNGDTGAFSTTLPLQGTGEGANSVVPACGANTVTVTTEEDSSTPGPTVGTATVDVRCASIAITPSVVGSQQLPATFQVTPQNFPLPGGFTLTLDRTLQGFTTTGSGVAFTGSPACGTHQVVLAQTFNQQVISAAAQITVLCPQITLTPAAIRLASQPATVLVTGSQFHPGQPVTISLNGLSAGSAVTDRSGGFSVPITAHGLDCAAHQVTASEQATAGGPAVLLSASARLAVTGCTMTLTLDPEVLQPGELTHVTGTGFGPASPVTLTWQLPGGAALPGRLTVTAAADGSIGGFFMVLPDDVLGARNLVATQGAAKVARAAIVDAGPMQPVSGGKLVYRQ
jgi:hypothetical protein